MKKYQFKTTINCGGCIAKVSPHLNENPLVNSWEVDITTPEKVLTVETDKLAKEDVQAIVEKLGFKAEPLA